MEIVDFISCQDDGTDLIISFALAQGEDDIRSLTLLRTPTYESLLQDSDRGVSVSLEGRTDDDTDLLTLARIEAGTVTLETEAASYELDVGRVDATEVSRMRAVLSRMNFDKRFRVEAV